MFFELDELKISTQHKDRDIYNETFVPSTANLKVVTVFNYQEVGGWVLK